MNNYEFCAEWILERRSADNVRVLDYGCGAGEIVKELRNRGVNAFGCDVFYEGGDYSKDVDPTLFGSVIRRLDAENCVIPFDDASFDFVVNNQVMEHVERLDIVLAEIRRVLKPGGMVLSLFPDKGVWREGHCGIPLLHWFPKGTRPRIYYAAMLRSLGFGHFKGNKSVIKWSKDFCEWLDEWTFYRTRKDIVKAFHEYFTDLESIEDIWLQTRLGKWKIVAGYLPASLQQLVVRKLGGLVFVATKRV